MKFIYKFKNSWDNWEDGIFVCLIVIFGVAAPFVGFMIASDLIDGREHNKANAHKTDEIHYKITQGQKIWTTTSWDANNIATIQFVDDNGDKVYLGGTFSIESYKTATPLEK